MPSFKKKKIDKQIKKNNMFSSIFFPVYKFLTETYSGYRLTNSENRIETEISQLYDFGRKNVE